MKEEDLTSEKVIKLFQSKPELVEKYLDIKINRDTLLTDYRVASACGRFKYRNVRTDMVFADMEGKDYTVKITYKQNPRFGLRDVCMWTIRYAEDRGVSTMDIVPALIIDEDTMNSYQNFEELDKAKIKYATFRVSDILKEFES